LYIPPHSTEDVREDAYQQGETYPTEITFATDNLHHFFKINACKKQITKAYADYEWYDIFQQIAYQ
jgi:hypothetical protein